MERIDTTTPEGKARINELLIDAIMNGDPWEEIDPPFVIHKGNYEQYEDALVMLAEMQAQGKIEFEYDPIFKAYERHCVFVHLKYDDDGFAKADNAKEIGKLISLFDGFTTDTQSPDMWNLSIPIYFPKET